MLHYLFHAYPAIRAFSQAHLFHCLLACFQNDGISPGRNFLDLTWFLVQIVSFVTLRKTERETSFFSFRWFASFFLRRLFVVLYLVSDSTYVENFCWFDYIDTHRVTFN